MANTFKISLFGLLAIGCGTVTAWAKPTSEEVFRSFKENMSNDPSSRSLLPFILAGAARILWRATTLVKCPLKQPAQHFSRITF